MIIDLVHSLLSSIPLLAYELTEILYSTCLLARFPALLSLGTRLGSPPRHFYGGGPEGPPIKIMGGELLFACLASCFAIWSIGWLICWLVGRLVRWMVAWLIDWQASEQL